MALRDATVDRLKCVDADNTMGSSNSEGTSSKVNIFANILISFVGAGILGLPYAFREVRSVTLSQNIACDGVGLSAYVSK